MHIDPRLIVALFQNTTAIQPDEMTDATILIRVYYP
jgi:hypothetical protein